MSHDNTWSPKPDIEDAITSMNEATDSRIDNKMGTSLKPDQILVNIKFSGLCHSSMHAWKDHPAKHASERIDGHEGAGVVVAVGADVKDLKIGDLVGIQWINTTCGACEGCQDGVYQSCPEVKYTGLDVNGTFGEYCTCQAMHAVRIPKHYPLDKIVSVLCTGLTAYKAVEQSGLEKGQTVAIAGADGGRGLLACQYAKAKGLCVLAICSEAEQKELYTERLRVDYFVDESNVTDITDDVTALTRGGPHAAIVQGGNGRFQDALEYVRDHGTVVTMGQPTGDMMKADLFSSMLRQIAIKGSCGGTKADIRQAMDTLIEQEFYQLCQILPLNKLARVIDLIYGGELLGRAVLKMPQVPPKESSTQPIPEAAPKPPAAAKKLYNVGNFIAQRIEELGVRDYFIIPGDSNLTLLDCLLENTHLRMIPCCNELNTGYAADGYARKSAAHIAVVVVPYIVGGLSILNAISGAHSNGLKIIVLSGCPNTSMLSDQGFIHHTPSAENKNHGLDAFRGVTAAAVRVDSTSTAMDVIDDAINKCLDNSLPVYIEVANDIVSTSCKPPKPLTRNPSATYGQDKTHQAQEEIVKAWTQAQRPVLLVGKQVKYCISSDDVQGLAEKLGCPVLTQPDGRHMPESHPQHCGIYWPGVTNVDAEPIMNDSDLWIVLGGQWSDLHVPGMDIDRERRGILHIEQNLVELPDGKCIQPINLHSLITGLNMSDIGKKRPESPMDSVYQSRKGLHLQKRDTPLTVDHILTGVQTFMSKDDTLIAEAGETCFGSARILLPDGADCLMQIPYASIGWGTPAALGAQIGCPKGRVFLMTGDGAFQMTAQEVSTMIRMKVNPIVLIFNNLGYKTETAVHEGPYNYIANWDYTKLASSFTGKPHAMPYNPYDEQEGTAEPAVFTAKVTTEKEMILALERARAEPDKLAFVECCIHPEDMTPELRRLGDAVGQRFAAQGIDSGYATSECEETPVAASPVEKPQEGHGQTDLSGGLLASKLKTTRTTTPKEVPQGDAPEVLGKKVCTDHMLRVRWTVDKGWDAPEIIPYGAMPLMPTANVLHYATQCFEGMKAYRGVDGKLRLLRPYYNCKRMLGSAKRVSLPTFDPAEALKVIKALVAVDAPKWLPRDQTGSSLYIRPTLIGSADGMGLDSPQEAHLYVIMSYWPSLTDKSGKSATQPKGLRLCTSPPDMVRAWPGGTGNVKLSANYGPSLLAQKHARERGYDEVLWLQGADSVVTEAGAANFFLLWVTKYGKLQLITASLDNGTILPGLTRLSVLELARERLTGGPLWEKLPDGHEVLLEPIEVAEQDFTIQDIVEAAAEKRLRGAFATGTAAGIIPVTTIEHDGCEIDCPIDAVPFAPVLQKWLSDIVCGRELSDWAPVVVEEGF